MKREEAMKLAQQGLAELNEAIRQGKSETLQRYLDVLSRFHQYSFNNALLIAMQFPEATRVAGFRTWKKLGRFVKKGEKGIGIIAPMVFRKKDDSGESRATDDQAAEPHLGFKVVHVFDVSQTEGEELPEFAQITGEPGEYLSRLEQAIRDADIELIYDDPGFGADGVSQNGKVVVRPDMSPAKSFAVLAHEFAHEIIHQCKDRKDRPNKTVRETEAEAVAHVVCRAIGIDSTTHCADYIQLYRGDTDTLAESLDVIQKTAADILTRLGHSANQEISNGQATKQEEAYA